MKFLFSKVLSLTICLIIYSSTIFAQDCTLPAPDLNIIEETEHSISFEWEAVDGAVLYQINLYIHDGEELIQQVQTEENFLTFHDLPASTVFTIGAQSGCTEEAFGPETIKGEKARTQSGLVIIVEDINIADPINCEIAGDDAFTMTVGSVPLAPLSIAGAIYLNIYITTPGSPIEDEFFEIVVFKNTMTSFPNNLLVGVLQAHTNRIFIDRNNNIFMNEYGRPNNWHFVTQVNDVLAPGNILEMRWVEDVIVSYNNCIGFSYTITPPPGHHNPALTSQNTPGEHSTATTTKQSSTTPASPVTYPNPVADRLTIELPAQGGNVQIMDINGKVWHQVNTQDLRLTVDMNNWPTGTYILRYDDGKTPHIQRVIKL
ncbi:MAG: T9SS type A sorting domain-containing protein [Lewinella sp.]|uniref:T9SS type A sorting domain-containing protein n=1 Tax=Lewinella sp. TaxID=2004506 RepID=UPI003D6B56F6